MSQATNSADYTVVVVYDNIQHGVARNIESVPCETIDYIDHFFASFTKEDFDSRSIHTSYFTNKGVKGNKYTACIPKRLNDYFSTPEGKRYLGEHSLNVVRYKKKNNNTSRTWGLFIPGPAEALSIIIQHLEGKFIRPESYRIIRPPCDETGKERNYNIMIFEANTKGSAPKQFIEKLKVLLEDTPLQNGMLQVKWLKRRVYTDVIEGVNKKIGDRPTTHNSFDT